MGFVFFSPQEACGKTISGSAHNDPNKNGKVDEGEAPLTKKKIYLEAEYPSGVKILLETTTDEFGKYVFSDDVLSKIPPGYRSLRIFAEVDQFTLVETPFFTIPEGVVDFQIDLPVNPSTTFLATSPSGLGAVTAIQEYRASQNSPSNPKNQVPVSPFVP